MHPFLEGLRPTLHISHRGGCLVAPENTMAAFQQAVDRWQTDMLELDVQATSDGVIVVAHDSNVERCTDGTGALSQFSFEQLSQLDAGYQFTPDGGRTFPFRGRGVRIPAFSEVLRAFPGMRINVELKPSAAGIENELASLLRKEGAVNRVCLGSDSDEIGARLHSAIPDACHFFPRDALTAFVMSARMGEEVVDDARYSVLDMPLYFDGMRLIDGAFLETARARGKWVNVWTVDDEAEMRALVSEGIGGIMTDRPDTLRAVLGPRR